MDYEQKYNEALKIAEKKKENSRNAELLSFIDDIFPELKDSKDEKIRKELIKWVKDFPDTTWRFISRGDVIAWLEKQGERKSDPFNGVSFEYNNHTWGMCARDGGVDILCDSELIKHIEYPQDKTILENLSEQKQEWSEEDENECNHILKLLNLVAEEQETKGYNNLISSVNWLKSIKDRIQSKTRKKNIEQNLVKKYGITGIDSKHAEGKLGEMIKKKIETENVDNADKIETEFHEGDWVVLKDGGNFSNGNKFAQIDSIELDEEMCYLDTGRWLYPSEIRSWTIDDAATGDILTDENDNPFIYCGHDPDYCKYITAYCGISFGEFTVYDKPFLWSNDTVEPATQEQRDSLLQKMKESGYAWNSEKKELVPTYKCEVCSHSKKE